MNTTMKKLLSVLLAVTMMLSLGMPALATDESPVCSSPELCVNGVHVESCALFVPVGCEISGCTLGAGHEGKHNVCTKACEGEHVADCDLYVAPESTCVEGCEGDVHVEGCAKYEAPKVCSGLEGCVDGAHDAECALYVPVTEPEKVCSNLEGCGEGVHVEGCALYVPVTEPEKVCKEGCGEGVHVEGCALYVPATEPEKVCKEGCVLEGEHETCMTAEEKEAADKAAAEAQLVSDIEALIAALPTVEEVQTMDQAGLTAVNAQLAAISTEMDKLTDKTVIDTTDVEALAQVVNNCIATLEEAADVTNEAELNDALSKEHITTINLKNDITCANIVMISKSVTINGNGYKVISSAARIFRVTTSGVAVELNDVNMVSTAVRVSNNEIRGISVDGNLTDISLTLNNCSVDFTDESAHDWSQGVNVTLGTASSTVIINGGSYEGANPVNINGGNNTVSINGATLTSLYKFNPTYWGVCVKTVNSGSNVTITNTTFKGNHAVPHEVWQGTVVESGNTDLTKVAVARIGTEYYYDLQEAVDAAEAGEEVCLTYYNELTEPLVIRKPITVSGLKTESKYFYITGNVDVACAGNVVFKNMGFKGHGAITVSADNANVTVTNSYFECEETAGKETAVLYIEKGVSGAVITIDAATQITITAAENDMWEWLDWSGNNTVTVANTNPTLNGAKAHKGTKLEATIGEKSYTFVEAALEAANANDVITLEADADVSGTYAAADATIDLNGYTLSLASDASVTTEDWAATGVATLSEGKVVLESGATLTIDGVKYVGAMTIEDTVTDLICTSKGGFIENSYEKRSGNFVYTTTADGEKLTVKSGDTYVCENKFVENGLTYGGKTTITGEYSSESATDSYREELKAGASYLYEGKIIDGDNVTNIKVTITGAYLMEDDVVTINGTYSEEFDGEKITIVGPAVCDENGYNIKANGSISNGEMSIYGPAKFESNGTTYALGENAAVSVGENKVTVPAGASVTEKTDSKTGEFVSLVIDPITDANGKDVAVISEIGTVDLPALGTVTLNADGTVVIDPELTYIDANNNGKIDYTEDVNIDRDGDGKADLNVDKNGNNVIDDEDDNVDTDGDGKPNYKVIKGANSTWTESSTWGVSFTVNGLFDGFKYIEIDGKKIDAKDYIAKSGSTIITLKADLMQELEVGKHTIKVVFAEGSTSTNFTVKEAALNPQTGDNSNVALWAVVFTGSVVGLAAILLNKKRKNENE